MLREAIKALVSGLVVCLIVACGTSHNDGAEGVSGDVGVDVKADAGVDVKADAGVDVSRDAAGPDTAKAEPEADAAEPDTGAPDAAPVDASGCTAGMQGCDGDNIRQCIGGAWSVVTPACEFGCNGGACMNCRPGEKRCNGLTVELCQANGSGWTHLVDCPQFCIPPGECVGGQCEKHTCVAEAYLGVCANGNITSVVECQLGCSQTIGGCLACVPGGVTCVKTLQGWAWEAQVCLPDGSKYEKVDCKSCTCGISGKKGVYCDWQLAPGGEVDYYFGEDTCADNCVEGVESFSCTP